MPTMNTIYVFAIIAFATLTSAVMMKPMRFVDYEHTIGLQRRTVDGFSDLVLQNQSQLIYHGFSSTYFYIPIVWRLADKHQILGNITSPV